MDTILLLLKVVVALIVPATMVPVLVYLERKIVAWMQIRIGPNRVGPAGITQPLADALKLLLKEDIRPLSADKLVYALAPIVMLIPALITFVSVPFGPPINRADVRTG